jgi:hypothetical protein
MVSNGHMIILFDEGEAILSLPTWPLHEIVLAQLNILRLEVHCIMTFYNILHHVYLFINLRNFLNFLSLLKINIFVF